ncbi:ankyrin repeat domain-containing protein [Leeuwenhoekiella marinoflava]|uniref:Ankyrin repeat protein n=2 Tax=Leeuwenhoekiella marinoflava TaxID=988 RepID=A0A4Q0PPF4_9FLAO|nr:ankyrin repeat domain-containing protein [Leeuwenhoekiella marinoflava]RXG32334.1 ankyrin repeat protein [Leeuwenhoekiella marinoflava]SHE78760.1 Ankyrin repeat-containing protein [Leeuwenhoekiella marinoflava DSM 3653]
MHQLKQAFFAKDYDQVEAIILAEASSFKALALFDQNQIISTFLHLKKYDFILKLSNSEAVILDVFELDKLSGSFIDTVFSATPFYSQAMTPYNFQSLSREQPNEAALDFFERFISKIENIEEGTGNESLLKLAINKKLPVKTLEILVKAGCEITEMDTSDNTLLFNKLQAPVMQWLIDKGLDVDHKNKGGKTPLLLAVENNQFDSVQLLLENGADTSVKDKSGNSIFHIALIDKVCYEVFDLLCQYDHPSLEETNSHGSTLLFNYIDRFYSPGEKELEYLNKLLEMGGDIHQINRDVYGEETTVLEIALKKGFAVFETLLKHNDHEINLTDNKGNTILHKVCAIELNFDQKRVKEQYKMTKLLLQQGADTTIRNTQDKTPLDLASDDNLKEKVVILLLKNNSK